MRPVVVAGHIGPVELELPVLIPERTEPVVGAVQWSFFYLVLKILRFYLLNINYHGNEILDFLTFHYLLFHLISISN